MNRIYDKNASIKTLTLDGIRRSPTGLKLMNTCGWGLEKWIGRRDLRCFCFSGERSNEQRQALTWLCSLEKAVPPVCVCDGIHLPHLELFCRPKHSAEWSCLWFRLGFLRTLEEVNRVVKCCVLTVETNINDLIR